MKTAPLATLALTLLAASLPLTAPVQAGTGIQRCQADDGTFVYTDKACAAFGAAALPMPGDVLNRIAREEARYAPSDGAAVAARDAIPVSIARRSPTAGCARSPTQLSMDLRGSLAMGDVNRLAESYHWVGLTHTQSKPIMQKLDRLTHQPLESMHFFDAQIGTGGLQLASAGASNAVTGIMQLSFGGELRQVMDFNVERYEGCYFIRF